MQSKRRMRMVGILLLTVALMPLVSLVPVASADCPGNVLRNPGFEEGFSERGAGEVTVANGWEPFWQQGPINIGGHDCGGKRPEYKGEDGGRFGYLRIHDGNWAQKWFNTHAHHNAGVYQQVNVANGSKLSLSAWAQAWSSSEDDPNRSDNGAYTMKVGIDPTGGTDPNSGNIVWSEPNGTLDAWVELKVSTTARAGTVTVFLHGEPTWCTKHNDVYYDDACLIADSPAPQPTAKPKPTDTPAPTATPEPTPTDLPEPTTVPTETPPPTPVPAQGAIHVTTFEDSNGNGLRDGGERLLAGAELTLSDMSGQFIASQSSVGSGDYVAFDKLTPGNYVVSEKDPAGYVSTSPNQWALTLVSGATLEISFADRYEPSPTPTQVVEPTVVPQQPEPPEPQGPTSSYTPLGKTGFFSSLYNVSGILVAALALILPLGLKAMQDRL